ncbi:flagellar hook-length control protein FliK [Anaerovorax odorimutans]|uniref:flagellar hook-length control protein FliK n=1 Tax=Anaerovorax odorimutans TaxID=109327 RepID=UPI00041BB28F|nr:flagellar hook-length control protein FliK [Anaerovorax odorimutans]
MEGVAINFVKIKADNSKTEGKSFAKDSRNEFKSILNDTVKKSQKTDKKEPKNKDTHLEDHKTNNENVNSQLEVNNTGQDKVDNLEKNLTDAVLKDKIIGQVDISSDKAPAGQKLSTDVVSDNNQNLNKGVVPNNTVLNPIAETSTDVSSGKTLSANQASQVLTAEQMPKKNQDTKADKVTVLNNNETSNQKATKQEVPKSAKVQLNNSKSNTTESSNNTVKNLNISEKNAEGVKQNKIIGLNQSEENFGKITQKTETAETKTSEEVPVALKTQNLDLSKLNIKVANSNNTTNQAFTNQIAEKIMYNLKDGKQEFDIQLNPKELGKIGIKIIAESSGAQIILNCSNAKTHSLLSMNTESLRGILENNTGLHTTVTVEDDSKFMGQNNRGTYDDGRGERQNRQQQENFNFQRSQDEENLSFINQLKFGLLEQQALL